MSKYIVKNCPAYDLWKPTHSCVSSYSKCVCERNADCLIKQVIDDCNESIKYYENEGWKSDDCLQLCGEASMSFKLLQLFEVEECEQ